jgi:hypothetical protein
MTTAGQRDVVVWCSQGLGASGDTYPWMIPISRRPPAFSFLVGNRVLLCDSLCLAHKNECYTMNQEENPSISAF